MSDFKELFKQARASKASTAPVSQHILLTAIHILVFLPICGMLEDAGPMQQSTGNTLAQILTCFTASQTLILAARKSFSEQGAAESSQSTASGS